MAAPTRQDDERDLIMLDMLARGISQTRISAKLDCDPRTISRRISVIRTADCAHEPEATQYWSKL